MSKEPAEKKKSGCLKSVLIAIVVFIALGAVFGGSEDNANPVDTPPAQEQQSTSTPEVPSGPTPAPAAPETPEAPAPETPAEPDLTTGQKNAIRQAENYLDYAAFSRSGLIGQLEYEGYSTEDATFAVDKCAVDWNEQAAKKAAEYLDFTSFSKSGLVEQLVFEGFTQEQAEYGANAAYK